MDFFFGGEKYLKEGGGRELILCESRVGKEKSLIKVIPLKEETEMMIHSSISSSSSSNEDKMRNHHHILPSPEHNEKRKLSKGVSRWFYFHTKSKQLSK